MIRIREAQAEDIPALLKLRRQWLAAEFHQRETTKSERAWFARYPGNSMALALVAIEGEQIVAYLLCDLLKHPTQSGVSAIIEEVCVAETCRRQGIGRRLVDIAKERVVSTVEDLTIIRAQIDREDERAIAFWRALGFEHHIIEFTDYL